MRGKGTGHSVQDSFALLLLLSSLQAPVSAENKDLGLVESENIEFPMAKQEMSGLRHRFFDPGTGALRYEIQAEKAESEMQGATTLFKMEKPSVEYFDRELMSLSSERGVIDLTKGKERIRFQEKVVGFLNKARTARFDTTELEMDFAGGGKSDRPIRFLRPGVVLEGCRSVFFRIELPRTEGGKETVSRITKVVVFGPGYALFDSSPGQSGDSPESQSMGGYFLVTFRGTASYSQLQPVLFFTSNPDDEADRVTLYGDGYVLKCLELRVHASEDMKTWDRVLASGEVAYQVRPECRVEEKLREARAQSPFRQ